MTLQTIQEMAQRQFLDVYGLLHPAPEDVPPNIQTILLLGPSEPGFWDHFTASDEYRGGHENPLDRWSERVISEMAQALKSEAFFPFGGPPYQPFIKWAMASGRAHVSPVGLLVHDRAGLWVSYRGALGLPQRLELSKTAPSPCLTCAMQPCLTACPVDALRPTSYDVAGCKADLDRPGNDCMTQGCATRRACPLSQNYARMPDQSAFHMEAFN